MKEELKCADIYCPLCGGELTLSVSFNGIKGHRQKRKTYKCSCGYSDIFETERERGIREGYID